MASTSSKMKLARDAWMVEALEAANLIEETESRFKWEKTVQNDEVKASCNMKMINAGIKLDRLESLLLNPHSKPILTEDDARFRSTMLLDFRKRIFALSRMLYEQSQSNGSVARTESNENCDAEMVADSDEAVSKPLISKSGDESIITKRIWWVVFCVFAIVSLSIVLFFFISII